MSGLIKEMKTVYEWWAVSCEIQMKKKKTASHRIMDGLRILFLLFSQMSGTLSDRQSFSLLKDAIQINPQSLKSSGNKFACFLCMAKQTRCTEELVTRVKTKGEQNSHVCRAGRIKRTLWPSHFPLCFLINKCHLHRSFFSGINRRNYTRLIKLQVIQLANSGCRAIAANEMQAAYRCQFCHSSLHRLA